MRQSGRTIGEATDRTDWPQPRRFPVETPHGDVSVDTVNGGMDTTTDKEHFPKNRAFVVKNGRVRSYWVGRRPGTRELVDKIGGEPVVGLCTFYRHDGRFYLVVVTPTSCWVGELYKAMFKLDGDYGGNIARVVFAHYLDDLYIANGVDKIHRISLGSNKLQELEESPRGRYITSYADRLVTLYNGYDVGGVLAANIAWSANSDPFDWHSESSGQENLIQSPTDSGDHGSGIFGLDDVCVILRHRSIWHGSRQPFAIAPFRFQPIISNIGCDLPYTAVRGPLGSVMWTDSRTRQVYIYRPGSAPTPLADPVNQKRAKVEPYLLSSLTDRYWAHATYDPFEKEYHVSLP